MKTLTTLFLSALLLTGCVGFPGLTVDPNALPPTVEQTQQEPTGPPPIVLPEQVTSQNTAYVLQALKAELAYAARTGK